VQSVLQALSVLIIGGIGAYIAWRQWRTAHDRLKLDLFDRRLAAHQRLKDAVAPIAASGKVTLGDTDRFARAMSDMRFLFDKETEACVDQIYRAMLDKLTIDTQLERTRARNKEKALLKSSELFKRITDGVFTEVPERMEKFMRFDR
jgi:ABC-type nickel/cobalt efflux system permease component RcnA